MIEAYFAEKVPEVNRWLDQLMPPVTTPPPRIHEAMRYSLMAGGKRLRPILVLAAGEVFGGAPERLYPVACAFEMVHTYSLIHDDLPAMDNDDLRRGMPTCHKQFDEATAILAGDGLMTHAFRILAEMDAPAEQKVRVIRELAVGSGTVEGMIAGQIVDLEAEGKPIDAGRLAFIHRAKTGALIRGALVCGGIVADAAESDLALLSAYGDRVGLAFQIADDILDETATAEQLGKTPGKDAAAGKATYPALYGLEASRKQAEALAEEAIEVLAPLGQRAQLLIEMARFVVNRTS
ncbi:MULTISPECIES: polyprenyl synthetase family protein [Chloracidobacterium]|jgi:geranylgeranyl diphosphate synthase type II|uniref:Farnesyl-diphosphate synthase n=1 Tax=Chloracidobacterium thermophilum (strain B) TaxID=981222 RepID=G2LF75_CHLTF|nr:MULTISPECIES: farnesyl diphosphate synthase [Chloracidobacterium]AEP13003.1 farnesyl-diphosphate synthase [Chloracidobacterium thermophilum B]QUV78711.1 polyprenyl synthetase family protein [Chloracidobacterium thermophilum]QUV81762.1 polyprenyl synthetase family protein [Chloracidobacterium sp. D]